MKKKTISAVRPRRAGATDAAVAPEAGETALFDPVERSPAYTKVSSAIEHKILSRALRDGDVLPAELDLAQQFRVHRSTVREALRQLESAGLVARPPGAKRMIVSRPEAAKVASGMRHALVLHEVTFVDVWEAMMVIEPEVAALAALRRTQADLTALTQTSEQFRDSPEGDPDSVNIVALFFEQIGAASRNQVLVLAKQSLAQALAPSLARMIDTVPQARTRITDAQKRIIVAVRDKNADEARKWMSKHVRDFKRGYEVAGISPDTPISV
ncbi:FadR/GntR family transcriptional regulator [Steroidobacter sp.]|uniref:FadR/GntR family transcriptional regulator n=1 Tax=Steroidobacter sp. TaxID=1978227 RepID=UPI001A575E82|nr:FCD domain-containing protein [Steroidobacter sp.]MBL8266501.1 FadR family transcriptional regulator [Steroidobacter sp.]